MHQNELDAADESKHSRLTVIALVIVVSLLTIVIVTAIVLLARNDWDAGAFEESVADRETVPGPIGITRD